MVVGGSRLVYVTSILGQESAALRWPLSAIYSVMPISGIIIIYHKISDIFLQLHAHRQSISKS
jgi:TRAP-type C4-dicarboxylate transport system permease small subunit